MNILFLCLFCSFLFSFLKLLKVILRNTNYITQNTNYISKQTSRNCSRETLAALKEEFLSLWWWNTPFESGRDNRYQSMKRFKLNNRESWDVAILSRQKFRTSRRTVASWQEPITIMGSCFVVIRDYDNNYMRTKPETSWLSV